MDLERSANNMETLQNLSHSINTFCKSPSFHNSADCEDEGYFTHVV